MRVELIDPESEAADGPTLPTPNEGYTPTAVKVNIRESGFQRFQSDADGTGDPRVGLPGRLQTRVRLDGRPWTFNGLSWE